jgi:hypothetical protein
MQVICFIELSNKSVSVCLIIFVVEYLKVVYVKYYKDLVELVNKHAWFFFAGAEPIGSQDRYLFVIL